MQTDRNLHILLGLPYFVGGKGDGGLESPPAIHWCHIWRVFLLEDPLSLLFGQLPCRSIDMTLFPFAHNNMPAHWQRSHKGGLPKGAGTKCYANGRPLPLRHSFNAGISGAYYFVEPLNRSFENLKG